MRNTLMERKKGLDFVRAVSAVGIIAYHFYCHSASRHKLFYAHANGTWGRALNFLFFALSGLVVHMRYGNATQWDIREYYYKRWKALMPAYLIAFSYPFLMNVFAAGKVFYLDIPKSRLLLTLFGMDGYVAWVLPTYFITGEWFLGAVLIAYLVYPGLRYLICRAKYSTLVVLAVLHAIVLKTGFLGLPDAVNPITCLLCFYMGMIMASLFRCIRHKGVILSAGLLFCILLFVPLGGSNTTKEMVMGWSLLVIAYNIGEFLCRNQRINQVVFFASSMSYYTFLLHHKIIYKVLEGFNKSSTIQAFLVLIMVIIVTFGFAVILNTIMGRVYASRLFIKFEEKLFTKHNTK